MAQPRPIRSVDETDTGFRSPGRMAAEGPTTHSRPARRSFPYQPPSCGRRQHAGRLGARDGHARSRIAYPSSGVAMLPCPVPCPEAVRGTGRRRGRRRRRRRRVGRHRDRPGPSAARDPADGGSCLPILCAALIAPVPPRTQDHFRRDSWRQGTRTAGADRAGAVAGPAGPVRRSDRGPAALGGGGRAPFRVYAVSLVLARGGNAAAPLHLA